MNAADEWVQSNLDLIDQMGKTEIAAIAFMSGEKHQMQERLNELDAGTAPFMLQEQAE